MPSASSCPLHRSLFTWAWVSSFTSLSISFLLDILEIIFLTAQIDWQHSVSKHKKVLNIVQCLSSYCLQTLTEGHLGRWRESCIPGPGPRNVHSVHLRQGPEMSILTNAPQLGLMQVVSGKLARRFSEKATGALGPRGLGPQTRAVCPVPADPNMPLE